jgi:Ca2+-binding EF-hand superfamily protein
LVSWRAADRYRKFENKRLLRRKLCLVNNRAYVALQINSCRSLHDNDDRLRPDNDNTLDLAEVKAAASAKFDALNKDTDGTLDAKEVEGIIGAKTFKAADPDNDGTLTKDEHLALVEKLFKMADVDHDGTLSVQELRSKAARTLKGLTASD